MAGRRRRGYGQGGVGMYERSSANWFLISLRVAQ